ncbi:hypothetical protein LPJ64_003233 [Coemansia asiatica]|uniref:Ribosomal protein L14e domain-containing protein n=1 Tax=Coemansia asiatica TaxID=1052880 RepID=A0A9W7XL89_9FUNG|nr:hypothetical protein LPJ64_003233 [Coemansia asiatica]
MVEETSYKHRRDELKGYVLIGISAFVFSISSVLIKYLGIAGLPSLEIVFACSSMQFTLGLLSCIFYKINPLNPTCQPGIYKWLVMRGTIGSFANACFYYSITAMPLANATVLFFTGPAFSALFAKFMLAEPYGVFEFVASALCLSGTVLVLKPSAVFANNIDNAPDSEISLLNQTCGATAAMLGAVCSAFAYCAVRKVGNAVHSMMHVVYFGFVSTTASFVLMFCTQDPRMPGSRYEWLMILLTGFATFTGLALLNRGLQLAPAGSGTLMRNLDIVFVFIFGITLFDEIPDWISALGATIIVGCTVSMDPDPKEIAYRSNFTLRDETMAKRRQIGHGHPRAIPPTQQAAGTGWAKKTLRSVAILYLIFVSLFTCPYPNSNPVCKVKSLAHSALVTPISNYLLQTETGARVNTAFNAHLVPFYQKHGAPVVGGANSFVVNTAAPVVKKATSPVCDAFHRAADSHIEKVTSAYNTHAKPAVDAVENLVGGTARNYVIPVLVVVKDKCVKAVDEYAVPFFKSAVNEHIVPFFSNHVQPRWRTQVKPALGHYSKVAVDYTRSSVLPSIADGGAHGYRASRDFASAHVVPHAKKATVNVYVFVKSRVFPPIYSAYARSLKPYVDQVVPWDKIDFVAEKTSVIFFAVLDVGKGFCEEFYYMLYTICTGEEHPTVIERLMKPQMLIEDKESAIASSSELPLVTEHAGQIKNFARKVSGSARQWVQIARGWVGSAVDVAKDGMATYASRMSATAEEQLSMATEAANVATEAIIEKVSEIKSAASAAAETTTELAAEQLTSTSQPIVSLATIGPKMVDQVEKHVEKEIQQLDNNKDEDQEEEQEGDSQKPEQETTDEVVGTEDASTIASAASNVVVEKFEEVTSNVAEAVTEVASDIKSEAADAASTISEAIADKDYVPAVEDAKQAAKQVISNVTDTAAEIVHEPASVIVDHVPENVVHVRDQAASVVESVSEELKPAAQSAAEIPKILESLTQDILLETTESLAVPTLEKPETEEPIAEIAADKAASFIYEARDAMAGVFVPENDKAMFEELVNSASDKVGNLEAFPSVINDMDDAADSESLTTTAAAAAQDTQQSLSDESNQAEIPAVVKSDQDSVSDPQTVVEKQEKKPISEKLVERAESVVEAFVKPETTSESDTDGDVRRSASNWVKDARMSISKEIAEERTRAVVGQAAESSDDANAANTAGSIGDIAESDVDVDENDVPVIEVPILIDDEGKAETEVNASPLPPLVENAVDANEKTILVAVSVSTSGEEDPLPAKTVKEESPVPADDKPSVTENANPADPPAKRANKPAADADASTTGDSSILSSATSAKGPRKIKKTKKRVVKKSAAAAAPASQGSFKRLVEVGRVVLINDGADTGKIAVIVDIVDHNRAIVDGPTTNVRRQVIAFKKVVLTDIVVKSLPRTIGSKPLAKFLEKQQVVEAWQKTAWAQKLVTRERRAAMTDFDRFKVMRLKKQQRYIVDRQAALLKKERA